MSAVDAALHYRGSPTTSPHHLAPPPHSPHRPHESPAMHESPSTNTHIGMLQDMGFSEPRCREALRLADNQPELAMEWLLQQAEVTSPIGAEEGGPQDHDLDASFAMSAGNEAGDEAVVGMLTCMGFTREAVLAALQVRACILAQTAPTGLDPPEC